ncbi:MAG: dTDP-glucose 4,6-dehydratase [Candidatus Margulisbacteria bacterium]|nr:dTDP-glucose 4,6-dehydratase [Candidatus Margulisiibacteriota bacterium]
MNEKPNVLMVTGGAGFIGSNFVRQYIKKYPSDILINFDVLTYAGNLENLKEIENSENYHFIRADISDRNLLDRIFNGMIPDIPAPNQIVHFAAESHVDRSIQDCTPFIQTNIVGTQVLLDIIRKHWTGRDENCRFIHVSTDEVYGSLGKEGFFTEQSQIKPNSPYSASKASSDLLVRSYFKTYGLPLIITRCSNNYGPYQFPEKLIPLIINNILQKKELPVYGKGENIRDWLFVLDHCEAIDVVLKKGKVGQVYNIGGHNEWKNIDIVNYICELLNKKLNRDFDNTTLIKFVTDRPGHDLRYAIDATKIEEECGWVPKHRFEDGIEETVDWYLEHPDWLKKVTSGVYKEYYEKHYIADRNIRR